MTPEESKALIRKIYDVVINGKDLDRIPEFFAEDYVDISPGLPPAHGPAEFRQLLQVWINAFPDFQFTIEDIISEGDRAAWRESWTGTHTGELQGIPPTGKRVTVSGMSYGVVRDGKAIEHRSITDMMGLLQQLGVVPMPEAAGVS